MTRLMPTDAELARLPPETEIEFRQKFVEDPQSRRIRFTAKGFAEYGCRFAKAGIDINNIKTRDAFRAACISSQWVLFEDIRKMVRGHKELELALKSLWS